MRKSKCAGAATFALSPSAALRALLRANGDNRLI